MSVRIAGVVSGLQKGPLSTTEAQIAATAAVAAICASVVDSGPFCSPETTPTILTLTPPS